jgi:formimidoylglutamate deiminase
MPVHVHVAEQLREVEECLAWSGRRPVEWLFEHAAVDRRWCLVHATHMTDAETAALARSGAVAGLCPTTEANLGDGLFQASAYLSAGGAFGIGSDSHVSVDPIEELRWLEYGQRLIARQRNRLVDGAGSVGERLFLGALDGGAQALGRRAGSLQVGAEADLVVLDRNAPCLAERPPERLLDALVFAAQGNPVTDAMVGGKWLVRGGRHARRDRVFERYRAALRELAG